MQSCCFVYTAAFRSNNICCLKLVFKFRLTASSCAVALTLYWLMLVVHSESNLDLFSVLTSESSSLSLGLICWTVGVVLSHVGITAMALVMFLKKIACSFFIPLQTSVTVVCKYMHSFVNGHRRLVPACSPPFQQFQLHFQDLLPYVKKHCEMHRCPTLSSRNQGTVHPLPWVSQNACHAFDVQIFTDRPVPR